MGPRTIVYVCFFFSSRRRHTRLTCDWSSDVCSSDLQGVPFGWKPSGGQAASAPVQVSAASHGPAAARQTTPAAAKPSAGQALLTPSQLSATSQGPVAGRHSAVLFASAGQAALVPVQLSPRSQT